MVSYFNKMYIRLSDSNPAIGDTITKATLDATPWYSLELLEKASMIVDKDIEVAMGRGYSDTISDKVEVSSKMKLVTSTSGQNLGYATLDTFRNKDVDIIFVDEDAVSGGTIANQPCALKTRVSAKINITGNDVSTIEFTAIKKTRNKSTAFKFVSVTSV